MMKRLLIIFFLILLFASCEKVKNPVAPENDMLITKLNMEEFRKTHLFDFELVRKRGRWREGREYVFNNKNNEKKNVFIRVGIHPSKIKANKIAEEYNSWCWITPREDTMKVLGIGDKLWWMRNVDSPDTVCYLFLRNNIFIIINSHTFTYENLLGLTKAIDNDLKNHADYITFEKSITPPTIQSISVSKRALTEGDTAKITVHASDPDNESLEYVFLWGLSHHDSDPENIFVFKASRSYVPAPFKGLHTLKFIVINESNVVSEIAETDLTIY